MTFPVEFEPDAQADFDEAADWFYDQGGADLKAYFIRSVESTLSIIGRSPFSFPVVLGSSARRAIVLKFPYAIFFTLKEDMVVIQSVFHTSRNPIIWRGRID
ncbi:MAG TPA: type II toxin-antitoxin system RelE/ParE family toxin [Pyrinomonadaceae bacterium]|nr:type II toxin-antitoxin system RelE/ParE family toxin [Pyrinomonadaceae bacterium]